MKKTILILSVLIGSVSSFAQFTDLGLAVFDYRNYEGQHQFITEDWTSDETPLAFGIESVRIPQGWEVWLYQEADFKGLHRVLKSNWDGNGKKDWLWRNDIRSVRIVSKFIPNPYLRDTRSNQGIALFKKKDFRGEHKFITEDYTSLDGCLSYGIESIRVPSGWEIWIYQGDNFTGRHKKLTSDWDGLANTDWQWHGNLRSIRIIRSTIAWQPKQAESPVVRLYEDKDQQGAVMELNNEWTVISSDEFWNDRISSIEIPPGVEVHLFEHSNYRGKVKILKRDWTA